MNFLQDVLHKQECCKNLVRNYWVGISGKIIVTIMQDCKKKAYLARNFQKKCKSCRILHEECFRVQNNLARSCKEWISFKVLQVEQTAGTRRNLPETLPGLIWWWSRMDELWIMSRNLRFSRTVSIGNSFVRFFTLKRISRKFPYSVEVEKTMETVLSWNQRRNVNSSRKILEVCKSLQKIPKQHAKFCKKKHGWFFEKYAKFAWCFESFCKSLKILSTYQTTQQRPETQLWLNILDFHASGAT